MKNGKTLWVLLAISLLIGCGESTSPPAPAPTAEPAPTATPAPSDDDWLTSARDAMGLGDYDAALTALDEVREKTDEAETLRARISFEQGDAALDAGDFAAAIAFYRAAEKVMNTEARIELAGAMFREDYVAAAHAAAENEAPQYRPWRDFILAYMGEPQTLEEFFQQSRVFRALDSVYTPLNETGIGSMDSAETQAQNASYIGPIFPQDQRDRLLILGEDAEELEVCGQGGDKALIVRRQQDYPRGAVYAAVDERMGLVPPGLEPASLDEVDYIIYLDYDYSVCAAVAGRDGQLLDGLQMSCVVSLVNEHTGEELFRSEKIMGAADYDNPYRLDYLAEDGWVGGSNPPIGQALAAALAALPD